MAWRTSSSARGASAISPLRTPRERAWPRPTMFSAPSALKSPTTAQTLEVPISSPTMIEAGLNMFPLRSQGFWQPGNRTGREAAGFDPPGGNVVGDRQVQHADGFAQL